MVESIRMTTRGERESYIRDAHYNAFALAAEHVYVDLQTDSGTGAMSDAQWSAAMRGDESYSGSRSHTRLVRVGREIFGYDYVQPVHQGRAAEQVLFPLLITRPGQVVVANTFFDTTRAHVALAGGRPVDCVCAAALDPATAADFKGDMDVARLEQILDEHGPDGVAAVVMTITNNSVGGQPVSVANVRATAEVARRHGVPLVIDAARFAENAFFVKEREPGYQDADLTAITRETFSWADAFTMSAKKDALVNMGGLLGVREDSALVDAIRTRVISYEGYVTYGGLSGRDLEALATGLHEGLDEDLLRYRVGQVRYLAGRLAEHGVPFQTPVGGHAVFVDAGRLLPHIPYDRFPGQALVVELYLEAGVRACDIGSFRHFTARLEPVA